MRAETRRTLLRAGTGLVLAVVAVAIAVTVAQPTRDTTDMAPLAVDATGWRFETIDGAGGRDGRVDADVGRANSSVVYAGVPHVFSRDATEGDLRHAWWTGTRWAFETLDGAGGPDGRVDADVGGDTTAVLFAGVPHVFYRNVTEGTLRHAWWTGRRWAFETLDGAGGPDGRVDADVGEHPSAVVFAGGPHVFYWDASGGDLRHAWWTGRRWAFETLDGAGGPDGRVDADVGEDSSAVLFGPDPGAPHVFYRDFTAGSLRHAWWTGRRWAFETLDGTGGPDGRVDADVGRFTATVVYAGGPHVFYWDVTGGDLRHAWWTGRRWAFETLNGAGGPDGRVTGDVGWDNAVVLYGAGTGTPHVFHRDADRGDLRHAWWTGRRWAFETLDGAGGPDGRVDADVGLFNSVVRVGDRLHVFSWRADTGDLRHARYG